MKRYFIHVPTYNATLEAGSVEELRIAAGRFTCANLVDEKYGARHVSNSEGSILISGMHPCHLKNAIIKHIDSHSRRDEVINMIVELAKRSTCEE